tara:strand:+ start:8854 stop:9090 length:237 start_codon:yes stop_codon:yes gene_type:complete
MSKVKKAEEKVEEKVEEKIEEVKEETKKVSNQSVEVYDANENLIREYSEELHGKDYLKLAEQFVGKEGRLNYTIKGKE